MVTKLKIFIENDKKTCAIYSISHSNLCHISFQLDANHAVICVKLHCNLHQVDVQIRVKLHCNLRQVTWLSASECERDRMRMAGEGNMGREAFPL